MPIKNFIGERQTLHDIKSFYSKEAFFDKSAFISNHKFNFVNFISINYHKREILGNHNFKEKFFKNFETFVFLFYRH